MGSNPIWHTKKENMKHEKKKMSKSEFRVKKHAKAIRETLKKSGQKVSAKRIANL